MKKVYASRDVTLVNFYKEILEQNGIETLVKNYFLTGGVGDLPPNECVPELWVMDDEQFTQAKSLLTADNGPAWQCECGEKMEGQFAQCWKCGQQRG